MTDTVEFLGDQFRVAERVSSLAVMHFAKVANSGVDTLDLAGLAAMYDLLEQCIHPDDWSTFEAHCNRHRADGEQLFDLVQRMFLVLAARPTGRPSDSSAGPRTIEPSSTADSSSPAIAVIERLNAQQRPDLALLVRKRQESLAS